MDSRNKKPKPITLLRSTRESQNFTLQDVADKLYDMGVKEGRRSGISADTVGRWERGLSNPEAHYRAKLCALYGKSAAALGLVEQPDVTAYTPTPLIPAPSTPPMLVDNMGYTGASSPEDNLLRGETLAVQPEGPVILIHTHQAIDMLMNASNIPPQQQLGALLALEAHDLATFFGEGWSVDEILEALRVVLPVVQVQAMAKITRRTFGRNLLQIGAAAVVSGIPIPSGRHISEDTRVKLHHALSQSIVAGWKLFHTASNVQVLAVGHAQLYLLQQASPHLYPSIRPLLYAGVYNLIGASLHFQGHYDEAYQVHERAYVAALEGLHVVNMARSRSCQANGLREQQRYSEALQTIEAALRLISQQTDTESIRLRAHLFASGAEIAALLGETEVVQRNLAASEALLEHLPSTYTEEFDHASWHQYSGTCALILNQHDKAARELQQAVDALPPQWLVRHATALMPLAIAYARGRDRDRCLATVEKAVRVIVEMNAPTFNRQFVSYLEQEILSRFPGDPQISDIVTRTRQHLVALPVSSRIN
jgi:transcriptional regulator with XRE-family HTH domain